MSTQLNIKRIFKGFTLVELSVVLMILSMLFAVMVTIVPAEEDKDSIAKTNENLQVIEQAIKAYFNQKGYLPCPAMKAAAIASANFGTSTNCSTAGSSPPDWDDIGSGADRIRMGAVPTRELNISDSYAFDGWNNRITYVAIANLAQSATLYNLHTSATANIITVQDSQSNTIHASTPTFISYVLVSHGKDGAGARNYSGNATPIACSGTANDGENCDTDIIFRDQFTDYNSSAYFDDIIKWKTKTQLQIEGDYAGSGGGTTIKYAMWAYRASGATNLAKATPTETRTIPNEIINTTNITSDGNTDLTFPAGRYLIRDTGMACAVNSHNMRRRDSVGFFSYGTAEYTFSPGCNWSTSISDQTFGSTSTANHLEHRSGLPNAVDGMGRGVNTGGGDNYYFFIVEAWEK